MRERKNWSALKTRKEQLERWLQPRHPECKFTADDWAVINEWKRLEHMRQHDFAAYQALVSQWNAYFTQARESRAAKKFRFICQAYKAQRLDLIRQYKDQAVADNLVAPGKCDPTWVKVSWPVLQYRRINDAIDAIKKELGEELEGSDAYGSAIAVFGSS